MDEHPLKARADAAEHVFISLSGGRDSTRAMYLVAQRFVDRGIVPTVLYVDNDYEFPGLGDFVREAVEPLGLPLVFLKQSVDMVDWCRSQGRWPSPVFMDCIEPVISRPIDQYCKEIVGDQDYLLVRGGHSRQRTVNSNTSVYQTVKSKPNLIIYNPLFEVDDPESIDVPLWDGYERGFVRTACWTCPFQTPAQWEAMEREYPELHDRLGELFEAIPYRVYPGDGHLAGIISHWVDKHGLDVAWDWGKHTPLPEGPRYTTDRGRTVRSRLVDDRPVNRCWFQVGVPDARTRPATLKQIARRKTEEGPRR